MVRNKIAVLEKSTIDKIAAGEVVERPSSVVKELVENAIDAGASAITVEIKDGGKSYIRITDNGCGIPEDELSVAFMRHSTSKLRDASELADIHTLGFRGEAPFQHQCGLQGRNDHQTGRYPYGRALCDRGF